MKKITIKKAKDIIRKSNLPKKVIEFFLQRKDTEWDDIVLFVNETYVLWDITKSHPSNISTNIDDLSLQYLQSLRYVVDDKKGILFSVIVKLLPKELTECSEKNYKFYNHSI